MQNTFSRRKFIHSSAIAGVGLALTNSLPAYARRDFATDTRVGMIGLDTSHCIAFAKALNDPKINPAYLGYRLVAAYPTAGSSDIATSLSRVAGYTEEVRKEGVEIVNSIEELLKKTDVILLTTIDGRKHIEQVLPVLKAGKRVFVDKPVAASLSDAIAIFDAVEKYKVPIFSSSSLRFMESIQDVTKGKIGAVLGADAYSPAVIENSHPDLFWYGIHGVEILYTVMGVGCKSVMRAHTEGTDVVIGTWADGRIGTFRGTRTGKHNYGGVVFGDKGELCLGSFGGYGSLLEEIVKFFDTGKAPVSRAETLEMCAFMEAADESKLKGGAIVDLETMMQRAKQKKG